MTFKGFEMSWTQDLLAGPGLWQEEVTEDILSTSLH